MSELAVRSLGIRTLSALLGAGALVGLAGGCLFTNTSHCGYKADGADNPCPDGFVCNVCAAANNGCVPFDQRNTISDSCLDSGGGTTSDPPTSTSEPTLTATTSLPPTSTTTETVTSTTDPTSTTVSVTTTETETETDTDPTETTGSPNCDPAVSVEDPGCAPLYCVAPGQCGPCGEFPGEVTCTALNPDLPLCDPDSGKCSECTANDVSACPANAPICDAGLCSPCTEHSQCPDTACDIEEGVCFPDDEESVFFVKGDNVGCGGKDGKTPETAFCNLNAVPLSAPKTTIRMLVNSQPPGQLSLTNEVVALVAHTNPPEISGQNKSGPTVQISGASGRLYLSKIRFRFAPMWPSIVSCGDFGTLYAHDVTIEGNNTETARAVMASDCKVRIHRAKIVRNGSGIQVSGGNLAVVNSFILDNGNDPLGFGAFNFVNDATARISYSTILDNDHSTFSCLFMGQTIELRNSAVLGIGLASNTCGVGVNMDKVAVNHGVVQSVANDMEYDEVLSDWLLAPMQDTYAPKKTGLLKDTAQWGSGDPRKDYAGVAIPTSDPSFSGAKQAAP